MSVAALFDGEGLPVVLGRCLGRGGEGAVYAVAGAPALAAKVYAGGPGDATVRRKLEAMIALSTPALARVAAWPQGLLFDAPGGGLVGFVMPRLERHRPIHALYGPAARRRGFPTATWAFLVRAARNLAAAFDTVHAHGHLVGDVNPANVVVSARATVRLIDCDSFQVSDGSLTWPCGVGVPLFTPPELQRRDFTGLVRGRGHDEFGLAAILFHLLMMGRHPFAGCRPGAEVTAEDAIGEGVFVFGVEGQAQGWTPPPFSVRLAELPPAVAGLFERAFGSGAAGRRPAAVEWVEALDGMETSLETCGRDSRHAYVRGTGCPWCRIQDEGGPAFFAAAPGVDLAEAWRAAEAIESPGPAGLPPGTVVARRPPGRPTSERARLRRRWRYLMAGGSAAVAVAAMVLRQPVGAVGLLGGLWALRPPGGRNGGRRARRRSLDAAELELRRLHARWERECGEAGFLSRRREVEKAKRALETLAELEEHERRHLAARVAGARLGRHLRRAAVADSGLPGLDQAVVAQLRAAGIETAAEVEPTHLARLAALPPALVSALVTWREERAHGFVFTAATDVCESDRRALGARQQRRRESLARVLRAGISQLAECRQAVLARRQEIGLAIQQAEHRLASAEAEYHRA